MRVYVKVDKELGLKGWYEIEDLYPALNKVTIKVTYNNANAYRTLPAERITRIKLKRGKTSK